MFKTVLFLGTFLISSAFARPSFLGVIQDASNVPIDGAKITVFDETGKGFTTSSFMGSFAFSGVPEGDYLFKVESVSRMPLTGAVHLADDGPHKINIVMLSAAPQNNDTVGAGSALRGSIRPPRSSSKPPKVKAAQLKRKVPPVYPPAERNAGVGGTVRIAMIILPDGSLDDLVVLSAPDNNLAMAALMAVKQWHYSPTYLDGQPVEASLTVDVDFKR